MATGVPDDRRGRTAEFGRLLFEQATDGVFISTPEGVYVEVNRSGHRMLGYEDGELIGKSIADVIMPHDLPRLRPALAAIARGKRHTQIWPMLRKDGSVAQLEVSAQPLSNGTVAAIVRELRERREQESKVLASEANLRSILHTMPDVLLTVDREGWVLFINRTIQPLEVEQVIGTNCFDYVPEDARPRVRAAIEHVFTTGGLDEYEVQSPPDRAGKRGWSAVRAGPVLQGDEVVAVTLCATDVTARKREEERNRELLERLEKIARLVPGLVYQYQLRADGSSCFPYASERMREFYGVSPEEVRHDASKAFAAVHPEDRPGTLESLQRSAATLEPWQHDYRVLFANGEVRWLFGSAVPERQADGSTLWHGFIADVTDHKRDEHARERLEEQLMQAQKMESVGQLAGGVAHDFNNLLTTVVALVELAQEEADSPRVHEYLEGVLAATNRGASLTQQLLAFARKKIVQPEEANLSAILSRMAPMVRRLVSEHIDVELSLSANLGLVKVDVGSMEQVIMNLIVNARDAMPNGGKLTLETQEVALDEGAGQERPDVAPGMYVVLSVTDTGTGMSDDVRSRLFEPFFTTKATGIGTGLGLAMCHGIVKQAGGTIVVDTELGAGTAFRIYLPRLRSSRVETAAAAPPALETSGHETVLLVEDEPMILRVARSALERRGYHVLCANDGLEALELARKTQEPIDVLVTDVVMPKLGGAELAARLCELRPGIKVLYTSGYAENALATQGVLRERVNFIQKPYALATLTKRVREVLDRV